MATPASTPDTRALVADFVGYKLRQKGYVCGAGPGEGPAADPLHQAMRAAGDEFETRFRRTFSDLAAQLHVTPGSAQQRFTQVSDELFQGGPNWGRLVAFFVFGAALCAESVNKEMEPLVGQVQDWMVTYLETRLADWIHSSGGWVRSFSIAALRIPLRSWSSWENGASGGGVGVVLGRAEFPYLSGIRREHQANCTPGMSCSSRWMGFRVPRRPNVEFYKRRAFREKLCTPPQVHSVGGGVGQTRVMARQAFAKDASSEWNLRDAMEGMRLTSYSAEEPRRGFRGARGQ